MELDSKARLAEVLIKELKAEAEGFETIGIVVHFDGQEGEHSQVVYYQPSSEHSFRAYREMIKELQGYLQAGGEPIGLIGYSLQKEYVPFQATIYSRLYEEYNNPEDEDVLEYFADLAQWHFMPWVEEEGYVVLSVKEKWAEERGFAIHYLREKWTRECWQPRTLQTCAWETPFRNAAARRHGELIDQYLAEHPEADGPDEEVIARTFVWIEPILRREVIEGLNLPDDFDVLELSVAEIDAGIAQAYKLRRRG